MTTTMPLPSTTRLWFGVAAAPAAWAVAEYAGYGFAGRACQPPAGHAAAAVLPITVAMIILGAIGVAVAYDNVQRTVPRRADTMVDAADSRDASVGRTRFMALGGMMASVLFLLGTVFFVLPAIITRGCAGVR
ncbi:MAG TPA: hypothetical protein VGM20_12515 [Gemmatimonadales bacterium]|jgi:hypothetical protein